MYERIADDELLYRSVRDLAECHVTTAQQLVQLSQSAFNDPDHQPSVDRASLRPSGPDSARRGEDHGVVGLDARSVRRIVFASKDGNHVTLVKAAPLPDNAAHALICADPNVSSGSAFRRMKEALCRIAKPGGWLSLPQSAR